VRNKEIRTDEFPEATAFLFFFFYCNKRKLRIEKKKKGNILNQ